MFLQDQPAAGLQACFITGVPDRLNGWEDGFKVPLRYSDTTNLCISRGKLDSAARREIVQAVATGIMNQCRYPTTAQIKVVSLKITEALKIRDTFGIGYVSESIDHYDFLIRSITIIILL